MILLLPISSPPGTTVQVTGRGFTPGPGVEVSVTIDDLPLGFATYTDAFGNFSKSIVIPLSLEPGAYTVEAVDDAEPPTSASATFTVLP